MVEILSSTQGYRNFKFDFFVGTPPVALLSIAFEMGYFWYPNERSFTGGSPGLVVMGGDSCSKGCGFKSQHRKLDGLFFHIFVVKIVLLV